MLQVPAEMFSPLAAVVPRLEFHHARLTDQQVIILIIIYRVFFFTGTPVKS